MLHIDVHGRRGARVALVHGFGQTRRSWDAVVPELARSYQVVCVDGPGHGLSEHFRADLWEAGRLLGQVCRNSVYVCHAMGARIALHLALQSPDLVRGLVLVAATAGIDDQVDRAVRRATDEAMAIVLERDGVDALRAGHLANPLFASLPGDARGDDGFEETRGEGLAASLRLMGEGAQEPLWTRLPELRMPSLFLAGDRDQKSIENASRMAAVWGGDASVVVLPDAGHACHLDQPKAFLEAVAAFLAAATAPTSQTGEPRAMGETSR